MISTESAIEKMTLSLTEEIRVRAPIDVTFATLLSNWGRSTRLRKGNR
jgi:hypothetical protein